MEFDVRDLLRLSLIPGIGPTRFRSLLTHFKDPAVIARATARQLVAAEGIEKKTALAIVEFFRNGGVMHTQRYVDDQLSRLNRANARLITLWDTSYPSYLKRIYDPPPFLFVRGHTVEDDNSSVAIVGTRNPSPYGIAMAERFSTGLAALGITVVSGLARGIDTSAHRAALKADGRTIAVIGSGVDVVYPPENKHIAQQIIDQGAIVSEFEMGAKPDAGNFPRRNRLISGMTLATLVVETAIDGGAMITATTALDQNRQVFALPSPVDGKRRSGTNLLIREGRALLTESVDDILQELAPQLKRIVKLPDRTVPDGNLSLFEQKLYDVMSDEAVHIDALAERSSMSTSDALVHLLSLEFKGIVRQLAGKLFVKC